MGQELPVAHLIRFGLYTADLRSGELYKSGIRLKLRDQSFQVLITLLEHRGEVVTREQLHQKLWPDETFVDFDHGLNAAIERLRRCLNDSASTPAFIETLPRRGYRFIGRLDPEPFRHTLQDQDSDKEVRPEIPARSDKPAPVDFRRAISRRTVFLIATLALATIPLLFFGGPWRRSRSAGTHSPHQTMLAVLPFENLSGDPNEDYFSDGLTEELITQLGSLSPDQLGVIARTTSMAYKGTSKSAQQIATELSVDYILESSIRRDGNQMRITVQLIRAHGQVHVWAHSYDRQLSHSIALQEEVAKAVAEQIEIKLRSPYRGSSNPPALDPQANEAYLRGRYFEKQFTVAGYNKAIAYFQQAIGLDLSFAEAYSGMAECYHYLVVTDSMSTADGESKALDAARKAVALNGDLAESHSALGSVMMGLFNWSPAEAEFKRAIELNPSFSIEHRSYAALLVALGRHDEAWEQINLAMRTDPLSLPNNAEVVRTLYYARDYDRAIEQARKALQLDADYYRTHFWLGRVYAQKQMHAEAVVEAEKVAQAMPDSTVSLTELAYSLASNGRQADARTLLQRLRDKSKQAFVPAYNFAIIHIALNQKDQALQDLQKAYDEKDWALMVLAVEPRLDPLRFDPRFKTLLRKMGLPS